MTWLKDCSREYPNVRLSIREITPEDAKELLSRNNCNRRINNTTVHNYFNQINKGRFVLNGESVIISAGGNLLDGQHRCLAVIKANKAIRTVYVTGIPDDAFSSIDQNKPRSPGDVFSIREIPNDVNAAAIVGGYMNLSKGITISCGARNNNSCSQEILDEYDKCPEFYQEVLHFCARMRKKIAKVISGKMMGGIIVYLVRDKKHPKSAVYSFFEQLYFNEDVDCYAITLLRDKLLRATISNFKMTDDYKTTLITKAWNSFITGKELKKLSWNSEKEGKIDFI